MALAVRNIVSWKFGVVEEFTFYCTTTRTFENGSFLTGGTVCVTTQGWSLGCMMTSFSLFVGFVRNKKNTEYRQTCTLNTGRTEVGGSCEICAVAADAC